MLLSRTLSDGKQPMCSSSLRLYVSGSSRCNKRIMQHVHGINTRHLEHSTCETAISRHDVNGWTSCQISKSC